MLHSHRQKLSVEDMNAALQCRNYEPLYGYDPTEPLAFRSVPGTGLFYVPNDEVDVETLLQEPLPKSPQPMVLTSHWLAIEGIQPKIPQNPTIPQVSAVGEPLAASSAMAAIAVPTTALGQARQQRELAAEDAEIRPAMKHILSRELQLYYDTIIADLLADLKTDGYSNAALAALSALRQDAGLQQLLPYFVQFIAETVPKSLNDGLKLRMAMDMLGSLLHNPHLFIEPYLHQVMPPTLTCIVGKHLGDFCDTMTDKPRFDHWALRQQAADLIALIISKYGNTYTTLLPRVTKTLSKAFDASKSLSSQYGAIVALTKLGPLVVDSVLLAVLEAGYLTTVLQQVPNRLPGEEEKVRDALREAARVWAQTCSDPAKLGLLQSLKLIE